MCLVGYNIAIAEIEDGSGAGGSSNGAASSTATGGNGANNAARRGYGGRSSDNGGDDTASNADTADGDADDDAIPTIGISSRGRIVRSKFNVRKHLASSKKSL